MATHATVPSPHLEGSAADRSTHPTPRADLRAKHEPQQQKKSPQRLQEGHTRTAITLEMREHIQVSGGKRKKPSKLIIEEEQSVIKCEKDVMPY